MSEAETALCRACCKPIPNAAKICTECDTYQDWRRNIAFGTTTLSLLVALIAVIGSTAPIILGLFHTPLSEVATQMATAGPIGYRPCVPCPERLFPVSLLVSNAGDLGGVVILGEIQFKARATDGDEHVELTFSSPSPHDVVDRTVAIGPRETKLVTVTYWSTPSVTKASSRSDVPSDSISIQGGGFVSVTRVQADGSRKAEQLAIPPQVSPLVRMDEPRERSR